MTNEHERPFPIRRKADGWEVVLVLGPEVQDYVLCPTEAIADTIADTKILYHRSTTGEPSDLDRVDQALDALKQVGRDERSVIFRRLTSYRDSLGSD